MRAVIKILKTPGIEQFGQSENVDSTIKRLVEFRGFFEKSMDRWWINQNLESTKKIKNEIIDTLPQNIKEIIQEQGTYTFLIFGPKEESYGLISAPVKGEIDIRFKNENGEKLQSVAERLIKELSFQIKEIEFEERISVKQKNSDAEAFHGRITTPKYRSIFQIAKNDKKADFWIGFWTLLITVLLIVLSVPPVLNLLFPIEPEWKKFVSGLLERLFTATIVTVFISMISIVLYYNEIKRHPTVKWEL
jgi:hypothetical protein